MGSVKCGVYSVECKVGSVKCEIFSNFDSLTTSKRKGFVAYPIDMAKLGESQRLKRRHVGA